MALTYLLAPWCPQQFFDANGDPLASGTAYFYQSGTTTGQQTYSDTAGTTNANPGVPLNSQGRPTSGAIYLDSSLGYKLVLKDSSGATISTYDPLFTPIVPNNAICQGRLTLTAGTPVTTSDVSSATQAFWSPYKGNQIALYDGTSQWNVRTFTEITISLVGLTASKPYDVFAYDNAGVVTIELLIWTSQTTRATNLTLQNGVLVKTGATTRRYLGTIYINASGGQTDDTTVKRYVWNYYNRIPRVLQRLESTATWTYTTATIRQANGSASNQVEVVVGWAEVPISLRLQTNSTNTNNDVNRDAGFGEDSTTAFMANQTFRSTKAAWTLGLPFPHTAMVSKFPAVGYHVYSWNEDSAATGTTTWYGATGSGSADQQQCGITGAIDA